MNKIKNYTVGILIPLLVGGLAAILTMDGMDKYQNLNQPMFAPPTIVFPIAWAILYILMGIGSVLIYREKGENTKKALTVYGIQLAVNFFWSIFFFNMNLFLFSFIWLVLLWLLVLIMIILFAKIKPAAAYLQFPYLLWLTFAAYLNFSVYMLNV